MVKIKPIVRFRTSSPAESLIAQHLKSRGWKVLRRGWPDFLAVRGHEIRFIEVKRDAQQDILKPHQEELALLLNKFYGINVEVIRPRDLNIPGS